MSACLCDAITHCPVHDPEPEMPPSLAARPVHPRMGLPMPVANMTPDGDCDFTCLQGPVVLELGRNRLCGLCGLFMAEPVAFLGGPAAAVAGTYVDPPMHVACAEAALRLCPHIARPHARRRPGANGETPEGWVEDKPQEWVLLETEQYAMRIVPPGHLLFLPEEPFALRSFTYTDTDQLEERP